MLEMLLMVQGGRKKFTQAMPAGSSTYTVQDGVTRLDIEGQGGAGNPEVAPDPFYDYTYVTTIHHPDGSTTTETGGGSGPPGYAPDDYCEGGMNSDGTTYETCYTFLQYGEGSPATTGADTTGFGVSFAGGTGGPAAPSISSNVAVNANQAYPIFVATGGSMTITYWK